MSELVSMKLSKKDTDAKMEPSSLATEKPSYPWGLSLSLDSDVLKKLGLASDDFTAGSSMALIAKVDVTRVSSEEVEGQESRDSVSLQITALCLEDGASTASKAAGALYGKE